MAAEATRKRKADEERGSGEDRPLRRSRRAAVVAKLSDSEGEEGANSSSEEEEEEDEAQQPDASTEEIRAGGEDRAAAYEAACRSEREMVAGGLRLALSLARVPVLPEFVNWSAEAREALLDAAVSALACASALLAAPSRQRVHRFGEGGSFASGSGGPEEDGEVRSLCEAAVDALTESLGSCLSLGELRAPPHRCQDTIAAEVREEGVLRRRIHHRSCAGSGHCAGDGNLRPEGSASPPLLPCRAAHGSEGKGRRARGSHCRPRVHHRLRLQRGGAV